MERLNLLVCLGLICVATTLAADTVVGPRGARPVEQGTRGDKCAPAKDWPFCTDDEWGPKCPSGCRIQGLMQQYDHSLQKKVENIRSLVDQYGVKHRSTQQVSKITYDSVKEKLTIDAGNDNDYYDLATNLRQRIIDMKINIDRQLGILASLKDRARRQVDDMQSLEVDIDIKLRSCKGSCKSYSPYQVDHESYVALEKQMNQLDSRSGQHNIRTLEVMKSRPLRGDNPSDFKSGDGQVKQDMFEEVKTFQLVLEQEGSSSSPATISKVPGTSPYSPSTSSSSTSFFPSSSSNPSKSLTEPGGGFGGGGFGGGGFETFPSTGHMTSHTTSCTKSTKTITVHTKDGPEQRVEEVISGGPECQILDPTKGGMGAFFPTLGHTSSSSSLTTKTSHSGTKGSLLGDFKSGFSNPFGVDLGAFTPGDTEDDVPDFQARSLKSDRVERQADYVGKDCFEAHQNHLKGETNGLFKIRPGGSDSTEVVDVYCQQEGLMGGWLLVQQRENGAVSFNRTWAQYRNGFGSVDAKGKGEFWLGNQNLHLLTNQGETMMKVELEDWEGGAAGAEYIIRVGSEEEGYPLHVSGYSGDAGDALVMPKSDMASYLSHNGMKFSTFDKDNDKWEENCAEMYGGGWWYNNCQSANLNGIYYKGTYDPEKNTPYEIENGVVWVTFKPAVYSLKTVRMFIRPVAF